MLVIASVGFFIYVFNLLKNFYNGLDITALATAACEFRYYCMWSDHPKFGLKPPIWNFFYDDTYTGYCCAPGNLALQRD